MSKKVQPGDKVYIHDLEQFGEVKTVTDWGRVKEVEVKDEEGRPKIINVLNKVVDFAKVIFPKAGAILSFFQGIGNLIFGRKKRK